MSVTIYERVIDLSEMDDGAFFVKGHPSPDLAWYEIKAFLNETLGRDGWSDLNIRRVSPQRGTWRNNPLGDDEWVPSEDGELWSLVSTEYEAH